MVSFMWDAVLGEGAGYMTQVESGGVWSRVLTNDWSCEQEIKSKDRP